MKNCLVIHLLLSVLVLGCNHFKREKSPINPDRGEKIFIPEYMENELLALYKDLKSKSEWSMKLDSAIRIANPKLKFTRKECSDCLGLGELFIGDGLDTLLSIIIKGSKDLVRTGDTSQTAGASGDGEMIVSLNYMASVFERNYENDFLGNLGFPPFGENAGEEVIVGVLDSGIDLDYFPNEYLWTNPTKESSCYKKEKHGWNFVNNSYNTMDGTNSKHGTLVNLFILREFLDQNNKVKNKNRLKLLNVKVLDNCNSGTLFDFVCGVLYAKEKGVQIINSSMGFYDNDEYFELSEGKNPIIYKLLMDHLLPKGILLVTAAGNKGSHENNFPGDPRDLAQNKFYPAYMSETNGKKKNNVLTVTTVNNSLNKVSPRQNYSSKHVDVGVVADTEMGEWFRFYLPFSKGVVGNRPYITGSSFANAMLTGKIAAKFDSGLQSKITNRPKSEWSVILDEISPFRNNQLSGSIWLGRYSKISDL